MIDRAKPDWKPPPEAVVTLTSDNFAEIVDDQELLLVEFYAPWCGHCKKLAPEFEKAAKQLAQMEKKIMLAKVDATVETDLAERWVKITRTPNSCKIWLNHIRVLLFL